MFIFQLFYNSHLRFWHIALQDLEEKYQTVI